MNLPPDPSAPIYESVRRSETTRTYEAERARVRESGYRMGRSIMWLSQFMTAWAEGMSEAQAEGYVEEGSDGSDDA